MIRLYFPFNLFQLKSQVSIRNIFQRRSSSPGWGLSSCHYSSAGKNLANRLKNEHITVREAIFVDEKGQNWGTLSLENIRKRVNFTLFDVVLVNAVNPIVCRVFPKGPAQDMRIQSPLIALKKFPSTNPPSSLASSQKQKELVFGTTLADHDYEHKLKTLKGFLEKHIQVLLSIERKRDTSPTLTFHLYERIVQDISAFLPQLDLGKPQQTSAGLRCLLKPKLNAQAAQQRTGSDAVPLE